MQKILIATAGLALMAALSGCVAYPGGYSSGAYAGYDGGFDSGYQGYDRPYGLADGYPRQNYASYAPPFGYYPPPQQQYQGYGPQTSSWYSTYYCPPQMGGY